LLERSWRQFSDHQCFVIDGFAVSAVHLTDSLQNPTERRPGSISLDVDHFRLDRRIDDKKVENPSNDNPHDSRPQSIERCDRLENTPKPSCVNAKFSKKNGASFLLRRDQNLIVFVCLVFFVVDPLAV